jgi:hypothetical protein
MFFKIPGAEGGGGGRADGWKWRQSRLDFGLSLGGRGEMGDG